jgi:hypothetical protein
MGVLRMSFFQEHAQFFLFAPRRVGRRARIPCLVRPAGPHATPGKLCESRLKPRLPGTRSLELGPSTDRNPANGTPSRYEILSVLASGVPHAKRPRWKTGKTVKASAEVTLIRKARFQRDLRQAEVGIRKKLLRQRQSPAHDVAVRCHAK